MKKALVLCAGAMVLGGTAWQGLPAQAAEVGLPGETGGVVVKHHANNAKGAKKRVQTFADNWDAWEAYNRAFTDGCWQDFATAPRRLTKSSDDVAGERSKLHRGYWWDFELGEGC